MANVVAEAAWGSTPHPPEQPRRVRVKLHSVTDVRMEMSKLYREARSGRLDVSDASRLVNILMLIGRTIESSDLERRMEALEAQA